MNGTVRVLLIACLGTVATILLSLVGNWLAQALSLRRWQVVTGVVVCGVLLTVVSAVMLLPDRDDTPAGPDRDGTRSAASLAELAPELLDARILTMDDSADRPAVFASRPDGTARELVWDMPDSWPAALVPDSGELILSAPWEERSTDRLELFSGQGEFRRALTSPAALESDISPAFDATKQVVYFVRQVWRDTGNGSRTSTESRLMRVALDGGDPPEAVPTPGFELRTVSVSRDGRYLAGQCVDTNDDSVQVCLIQAGRSTVRRLPGNERAAPGEVSVSPDGRYVAYSSPATNAYGQTQVYVHDRGADSTTMISRFAGLNGNPSWAPGARKPCLAFSHFERPTGSSIHIACLTPKPVVVASVPVGSSPVWLS